MLRGSSGCTLPLAIGAKRVSQTAPQRPSSETGLCERATSSPPRLIDAVASNSQSIADDRAIFGDMVTALGNEVAPPHQGQGPGWGPPDTHL